MQKRVYLKTVLLSVLLLGNATSAFAQNPFRLMDVDNSRLPDKCLTPLVIYAQQHNDQRAHDIRTAFESFSDKETQNTEFFLSLSGKFLLSYTRTGNDAVPSLDQNSNNIPDYIERAAQYADESYNYLVKERGFVDPVLPGVPYEIRFREINSYGFTQSQGTTSFIVIHRNFEDFPSNNDPDGDQLGALKVTIAHEFKHAIQYATSRWQGNSGLTNWLEMDATMIEEVVYPEVDDYVNYLNVCSSSVCSVIRDPNRSTPGSYYHATWMLYFDLAIDDEFWVDVWDEIRVSPQSVTMFSAIDQALRARDRDFATEFTRNHLWHAASGTNSLVGYGFPDAALFPNPKIEPVALIEDSTQVLEQEHQIYAAQYLSVSDLTRQFGEVILKVDYDAATVGAGILAYNTDGTWTERIETGSTIIDKGFLRINTGIQAQITDKILIALANPGNSRQQIDFSLFARELPEEITLAQNYPNPFNPSTTIPFSLPESGSVRLDVFDTTGRLVQTLVNGTLERGFYDISFRGEGMASGVYLYRLSGPGANRVGKMLLLK